METIKPGKYRHFKGKIYEVLGVARHSETLEEMVVYKALYSSDFGRDALWIRPLDLFLKTVEKDGEAIERFTYMVD